MDRNHHSAILVAVLLVTPHIHVAETTEYEDADWTDYVKCMGAAGVGGAAATVLGPYAAGLMGFTKAGIAGGSIAAKLMGLSSVSGYGTSAIAYLQSIGAAGLGGGSILTASAASCLAAWNGRKEKKAGCTSQACHKP